MLHLHGRVRNYRCNVTDARCLLGIYIYVNYTINSNFIHFFTGT